MTEKNIDHPETIIADFLGDIYDGNVGRQLSSSDYEICLRPLARALIGDLQRAGHLKDIKL